MRKVFPLVYNPMGHFSLVLDLAYYVTIIGPVNLAPKRRKRTKLNKHVKTLGVIWGLT